ncbi:replication protein A 70 kDa DNA-binding subunit-like [Watersipora subatra]|uniref:replication protein A 70 kDa DNA-binding subunit-like n=1 Tax=Watersipora subatra TaxID=2589382 RepID=UPI00355C01E3
MESLLTTGGLKKLLSEVPISSAFQPVLQVVALKEITKGSNLRYRVYVHDGEHSTSNAMLAAQHSQMVQNKAITANCLIKVTDYTLSLPSVGKKVLCIAGLVVIKTGEEVGKRLGDPVAIKVTELTSHQPNGEGVQPLKDANTSSGFYGNRPQQQKPKEPGSAGSAGTPGGGVGRVYPIASLTPYQNKWTIKARVTQKSAVRTYSNSRGEGKFFNCVFTDESGEIKATAWKTECDAFFEQLELNKVYFVSKGQLKTANKQFSNTNNDYEMNLSADTRIVPCDDSESSSVPAVQYKFVTVADLSEKAVGSLIDICGVVHNVGDINTIIAKVSQKEMMKRDIELVDDTNMAVRLTVWGEEAAKFSEETGRVLAVRGCKISDWNGRSLSSLSSSQLILNPDCTEGHQLRGWYDTHGGSTQFKSYASDGGMSGSGSMQRTWKTFDCIQTDKLGMSDKPDYYSVKAMAAFIKKDNCMYMACASEGCNKKVIDNGDGTYRCEKCNKTMPEFKYRLLLQINMADSMGFHWVTAFQDSAEKLLGKTAKEMGEMKEDEELFDSTLKNALYKPYQMTLRSKMESYNDDNRLKTVMVEMKDLDIVAYNKRLLGEIKRMRS